MKYWPNTPKIVYILEHCKWGPWNKGECDKTCGKNSHRINTRKIEVNESYGGNPCEGEATEKEECKLYDCPRKTTVKYLDTKI